MLDVAWIGVVIDFIVSMSGFDAGLLCGAAIAILAILTLFAVFRRKTRFKKGDEESDLKYKYIVKRLLRDYFPKSSQSKIEMDKFEEFYRKIRNEHYSAINGFMNSRTPDQILKIYLQQLMDKSDAKERADASERAQRRGTAIAILLSSAGFLSLGLIPEYRVFLAIVPVIWGLAAYWLVR